MSYSGSVTNNHKAKAINYNVSILFDLYEAKKSNATADNGAQ